jgi:hypothetical protein
MTPQQQHANCLSTKQSTQSSSRVLSPLLTDANSRPMTMGSDDATVVPRTSLQKQYANDSSSLNNHGCRILNDITNTTGNLPPPQYAGWLSPRTQLHQANAMVFQLLAEKQAMLDHQAFELKKKKESIEKKEEIARNMNASAPFAAE